MNKKKKIILISVISLVIVLITIGIIALFIGNNKKEKISQVKELYNILKEKNEYSFTMKADKDNGIFYAKKGDKAYVRTKYGDEKLIENIVKEGNTYLIKTDDECYYVYKNNDIELNKIEVALKELENMEYTKGKEKIDNTKYEFEEYKKAIPLTMLDLSTDEAKNFTTRFYFKDNDLKYIKTFKDDKQELLKVEISDNVDSKLFEIPSNFVEK